MMRALLVSAGLVVMLNLNMLRGLFAVKSQRAFPLAADDNISDHHAVTNKKKCLNSINKLVDVHGGEFATQQGIPDVFVLLQGVDKDYWDYSSTIHVLGIWWAFFDHTCV